MNEDLIEFLVLKYGKRIDGGQPLTDIDHTTIQKQLNLVDKNISNMDLMSIVWAILGTVWLILSLIPLAVDTVGLLEIFKVILGFVYIFLGYYSLYRGSELKKKKVILETILFVNQRNS
ncbi:hypothetical protein [Pararhodonellum marinum]|uniref:hypothetical protein n=1 Tax=Pararhodonellum marinum TaxID=2755358 RepID=UPI0018907BA2|nr:hypothetical protein [Pararhodonellum marinum]